MGKRKSGRETGGLASIQKALIAEGGSIREVAKRIVAGMDATYVEVVKHKGKITDEKVYADHPTRLKAVTLACGIHAPRARGKADEIRPILNVQAGARVQMVFFGEVRDAADDRDGRPSLPTPISAELRATLVRQGKVLPDGTAPQDEERPASADAPKARSDCTP